MIVPVIVTYNSPDDFYERAACLLGRYPDLVVVDNASSRREDLYRLRREFPGLRLIENSENLGIAAALNQGCRAALELGADWILTLDQDSEVSEGMVETMLASYEALPEDVRRRCVSLFPSYEDRNILNGKKLVSRTGDTSSVPVTVEITSGNLLRRDVFEKVGWFDESLFIDYVDHDFCLRINLAGYELRQCSGAVLMHQLGDYRKTSFLGFGFYSSNCAPIRCYYRTRNRLEICRRYADRFPLFVKHDRKTFFISTLKILLGEKQRFLKLKMIVRGIRDYYLRRSGKPA